MYYSLEQNKRRWDRGRMVEVACGSWFAQRDKEEEKDDIFFV
jgi:hypothetical protein